MSYTSGATGFGWDKEYDGLEDFEDFINDKRKDYTAKVTVFDNTLQDFIFWKDTLTYDTRIDILHNFSRDMRTITRKRKIYS